MRYSNSLDSPRVRTGTWLPLPHLGVAYLRLTAGALYDVAACCVARASYMTREVVLAAMWHALRPATCEQKQPGRRDVWLVGIFGTRGRGNLAPASMSLDRRQVHVDGVFFEFRRQLTSGHSTERDPNLLVESHVHSAIVEAKVIGDVVPGDTRRPLAPFRARTWHAAQPEGLRRCCS